MKSWGMSSATTLTDKGIETQFYYHINDGIGLQTVSEEEYYKFIDSMVTKKCNVGHDIKKYYKDT